MQAQKAALAAANGEDDEGRISLSKANMDSDIYGDKRLADYHSSIPANEDADYDVSTYYCFKSFLSILIILFFYRMMIRKIQMVLWLVILIIHTKHQLMHSMPPKITFKM